MREDDALLLPPPSPAHYNAAKLFGLELTIAPYESASVMMSPNHWHVKLRGQLRFLTVSRSFAWDPAAPLEDWIKKMQSEKEHFW